MIPEWLKLTAMVIGMVVPFLTLCLLAFNGLVNVHHFWKIRKLTRISLEEQFGNQDTEVFTKLDFERATQYYIPQLCSSIDPTREADFRNIVAIKSELFPSIDAFIETNFKYQHLLILADSGMGKTSALLNYYVYNKKKKQPHRIVVIPLGMVNPEEIIEAVKKPEDAVLCLDAFDEDTKAIQNHVGRLRDLVKISAQFAKVIITCRTQFFLRDEELPVDTGLVRLGTTSAGEGKSFEFTKFYLWPFEDFQVDNYLRKRFKRKERQQARTILAKIPDLYPRPMILAYLSELIEQDYAIENVGDMYNAIVEAWVKRENFFVNADTLRRFSQHLAYDIFNNREQRGSEDMAFHEVEQFAKAHGFALAGWQITGRSLLNRNAVGKFKFAHRSIMEFLYVCHIAAQDPAATALAEPTDQMKVFFGWKHPKINDLLQEKERPLNLPHAFLPTAGLEKIELQGANMPQADLRRATLSGAKLMATNLKGAFLIQADLKRANLKGTNLQGANLMGANLLEAKLPESDLKDSLLLGAHLERSNLWHANLEGANLTEAKLGDAYMQRAKLERATLKGANLKQINGQGAKLMEAKLQGANLHGADLWRADLERADLDQTNLIGANLKEAELQGSNIKGADLRGASLEKANLKEASLQGTTLRDTNLQGANLQDADLVGFDLHDANLQGANLLRAKISGARLRGANLTDANLREANLQGTNLQEAELRRANLGRAILREANLQGATLAGARLLEAKLWLAKMQGADLRRARLIDAKLEGADLMGAILEGATLRGAVLRGTNLRKANLQRTNLWQANLQGANLMEAALQRAKLNRANLMDAHLQDSILDWSQLRKANLQAAILTAANLIEANLKEANLLGAKLAGSNLAGANLKGVQNWKHIDAIEGANITGIKNAPVGFVAWALAKGAIIDEAKDPE